MITSNDVMYEMEHPTIQFISKNPLIVLKLERMLSGYTIHDLQQFMVPPGESDPIQLMVGAGLGTVVDDYVFALNVYRHHLQLDDDEYGVNATQSCLEQTGWVINKQRIYL